MNNLLLKADTVCPHCRAGQVGRSSRCPPQKREIGQGFEDGTLLSTVPGACVGLPSCLGALTDAHCTPIALPANSQAGAPHSIPLPANLLWASSTLALWFPSRPKHLLREACFLAAPPEKAPLCTSSFSLHCHPCLPSPGGSDECASPCIGPRGHRQLSRELSKARSVKPMASRLVRRLPCKAAEIRLAPVNAAWPSARGAGGAKGHRWPAGAWGQGQLGR